MCMNTENVIYYFNSETEQTNKQDKKLLLITLSNMYVLCLFNNEDSRATQDRGLLLKCL